LCEILFGNGGELIIHFGCGVGFVLTALAVFDFEMPRWITWIGSISASVAGFIFLLQGVSNLVPGDSLHYYAFTVLGQWSEKLAIDLLILWFVAMLLMDSEGTSRLFGFVVMAIVVSLEIYSSSVAIFGITAAGSLKLFFLLVFVWLLLESRKKIYA
jgi:hypothetical protein